MHATQWIVVGAVMVGGGAGFLGAQAEGDDGFSEIGRAPLIQPSPPVEEPPIVVSQAVWLLAGPPTPLVSSQPQGKKGRERWTAPTMYVYGRVSGYAPQVASSLPKGSRK